MVKIGEIFVRVVCEPPLGTMIGKFRNDSFFHFITYLTLMSACKHRTLTLSVPQGNENVYKKDN